MNEPLTPECTCTPLNRALMAHLLRVDEGSVHEQGCLDRVLDAARSQPTPTLHAGLLADAIYEHDHVGKRSEEVIRCGRGDASGCADRIAAKYAALAASQPVTPKAET